MTKVEMAELRPGDQVTTRIGSETVLCVVVVPTPYCGRHDPLRVRLRRVAPGRACASFLRHASEIALASRYDPLTANVFADWLEENGEIRAATKLRAVFPLAPAVEESRGIGS